MQLPSLTQFFHPPLRSPALFLLLLPPIPAIITSSQFALAGAAPSFYRQLTAALSLKRFKSPATSSNARSQPFTRGWSSKAAGTTLRPQPSSAVQSPHLFSPVSLVTSLISPLLSAVASPRFKPHPICSRAALATSSPPDAAACCAVLLLPCKRGRPP